MRPLFVLSDRTSLSLLALAGVIFVTTELEAKEKVKQPLPPRFLNIAAASENSWLSMDCQGKAPYMTISCRFTQTSLRTRSEQDTLEELEGMKKSLSETPVDQLRQQFGKQCGAIEQAKTQLAALKELSAEKAQQQLDAVSRYFRVCQCADKSGASDYKDCVSKWMTDGIKEQSRNCSISANTFELTFKKVGDRKWINNPGPEGLCDMVAVRVIEHEPDSYSLWTYSQTRVAADTESSFCKHLELNKPFLFSWKYPQEVRADCKLFKPGLF